jgi:hypothetical protein
MAGAIDTDQDQGESWSPNQTVTSPSQDDNSGAAPVTAAGNSAVQDDSTGVDQAVAGQQQQQAIPTEQAPASLDDNRLPQQGGGPNPQRIASYILADKAAPPETLETLAKIVDPTNKMSPADRNLVALDYVKTTKGPEAAVPILQANQKAFTAYQNVALAAANGTQQKPADLKHATDAANMAQQHVLDGSHVNFAPGPNGSITATVSEHGSKQATTYQMDVDQFKSFVDMKQGGLWDKQMAQGGAPAVLKQIVGDQQGTPVSGNQVSANANNAGSNQTTTKAGNKSTSSNEGPDTHTVVKNYQDAQAAKVTPEEAEEKKEAAALDAQSRKIFPWISQERQRQSWIAQQQNEVANRQNKIDVEKEKGTWHVDTQNAKSTGMAAVANIKADAQTKAAAQHYMQEAMKQAAVSGREQDRRAVTIFGKLVNDPNAALRSPGDIEKLAAQAGVQLSGIEKFKPQAQPQQEAHSQTTAPSPAPKPTPGAPTRVDLSPLDQQALSWARANPKDPKAVQIMQHLSGAQQ